MRILRCRIGLSRGSLDWQVELDWLSVIVDFFVVVPHDGKH